MRGSNVTEKLLTGTFNYNNKQNYFIIGGDFWFHGEERESRIYLRTDETVFGQERLHPNTDHQQEDQHQIL